MTLWQVGIALPQQSLQSVRHIAVYANGSPAVASLQVRGTIPSHSSHFVTQREELAPDGVAYGRRRPLAA